MPVEGLEGRDVELEVRDPLSRDPQDVLAFLTQAEAIAQWSQRRVRGARIGRRQGRARLHRRGGRGVRGRLLAGATDAVLAAGALRASMARIAYELEPAFG